MLHVRKAADRGGADYGWLQTAHTFSFSVYHDPDYMGFRHLRVINEDVVGPAKGFQKHPHRDMEIITYVLSGALEHRDDLGNASVLRAGELQRMTAGTGIRHSEANPSVDEPVHLYQIWVFPDREGLEPGYEQKGFDEADRQGKWQVVVSPDGRDGSLVIHQNVSILLADLGTGQVLERPIAEGRHAWVQVIRGPVVVNGEPLETSDALAISDESSVSIKAEGPSEILLFDLA
ncbi:pirin family protein [Paludisphaera borealis]|uniref:Quercetin 2,3-dioxygenase n=1 Tax=Paludisphaera borealis TaxID=1387353 RepID=A0A1U7CQY5_9BACT|nr:pirin family protein [Paludisphaera borealis]APW61318.1 Quercetin 2,3-dioxygenase [Paludisphaera borealis]